MKRKLQIEKFLISEERNCIQYIFEMFDIKKFFLKKFGSISNVKPSHKIHQPFRVSLKFLDSWNCIVTARRTTQIEFPRRI